MIVTHYQFTEAELNNKDFEEGALYVTTDTNKLYSDPIGGVKRTLISGDPIILSTELERESLLAPIINRLYIVLNTGGLYIYCNSSWVSIAKDEGISQNEKQILYNLLRNASYKSTYNSTDDLSNIQSLWNTANLAKVYIWDDLGGGGVNCYTGEIQYREGDTWAQFIESEFNTYGFKAEGNYVILYYPSSIDPYICLYDDNMGNTKVTITDSMNKNTNYVYRNA